MYGFEHFIHCFRSVALSECLDALWVVALHATLKVTCPITSLWVKSSSVSASGVCWDCNSRGRMLATVSNLGPIQSHYFMSSVGSNVFNCLDDSMLKFFV